MSKKAEIRKKEIKDMLETDGEARLSELAVRFPDVSEMTLRRDLIYFEEMGFAFRTHGGARIREHHKSEPYYKLRETENRAAKEYIAKLALQYIQGQTVFLDSGTTMMAFARSLKTYNLDIVTTGPNIALELAATSNSAFRLLGGQLNRHNLTVSGSMAMENVGKIGIDTAFMASSGYTLGAGFTCGSQSEAELKRLVVSRAVRKILLMDSSKFGRDMLFSFAELQDIQYFITDMRPPEWLLRAAREASTKVVWE
ncbi:GntR family transcriptional regulator [Clostridia bacterium]|nr:GntR family transcriptional regulator [Clostridia bacterium]